MSAKIIGGMTPQYYHTLPDKLDEITTNPLKENIFKMLSQISDVQFPEFVADILTKVEGHTLCDITDGQGDEKQDILTFDPSGRRCLTQCKHTIYYNKHYNGNELDLMVVACMRKDCKSATFVTNSDLTPQGKKYVTDKEYERGQTNMAEVITVDYWNDLRLWERIKNNSDILNKWFSGLGQTHAMRSIRFEVALTKLPLTENSDHQELQELLREMESKSLIQKDAEKTGWTAICSGHQVSISTGIQIDGNLGVLYHHPVHDNELYNRGLPVLSIEVRVNSDLQKYQPNQIKDQVIRALFNPVLTDPGQNEWWHLVTGPSSGFLFLHDISEPRQVILDSGVSYVKLDLGELIPELEYISMGGEDFRLLDNQQDDDDSIWLHGSTAVELVQWIDQRMDPVEVYNNQVFQMRNLDRFKSNDFFAVTGIAEKLIMRIRRYFPNEWTVFQVNSDTVMFCTPDGSTSEKFKLVEKKIALLHLQIKPVRPQDRDNLLQGLKNDMPPATSMFVSGLKGLNLPVDLQGRIFWLKKDLNVAGGMNVELATELLKFKLNYDNQNGYDHMAGKTEMETHTSELPELLWDIFSFRGSKMIDIAIYNNPITISLRYREEKMQSSQNLAELYLKEFLKTYSELETLIENWTPAN